MKAFSFLNGSKKTQQEHPQRQQQRRTQLSITIIPRSSQDHDPFYSHQIPTPRTTGIQSPAYSTISFFSSKSAPSRAGSGTNTPEPSQSMHASESGSGRSNGGHGKSRPSLALLRPRMSSDSNHHSSAEHSQKVGGAGVGGRLNIYNRFGFSKSSSQLPQDVPSTPTYPTPPPVPIIPLVSVIPALSSTEPVTPNRQYQLLHQQMFPESAPIEVVQPFPPAPQIDREPSPTPVQRHSPPKANKSTDDLDAPGLNDPASTSLILQRRRAKSLGHANPGSAGVRVTALKLPTPVVDPAPPLPPSRASSTKSSSIPRPVNMHLPPPNALTVVLPPTPMSSASSLTSEQPPFSSGQTPNRMRSESSSTRSRSESNSSRARSESNSSSASSSRHGHGYSTSYKARSSKTAAMGRLDDFWDGFLKEIDEDISDLCANPSPAKSAATTPTRPARLEEHDIFLGPEGIAQTAPLVTRSRAKSSPLRKGTAKLVPEPTPSDASKSRVQTITIAPRSDLTAARSLRSPPMTATLVTIARSPDINTRDGFPTGPFEKLASHDSISSLAYLNSPGSSFRLSPDLSTSQSPQLRGIQTQNPPTFSRTLSPANLRSLDPPFSQPTTSQPTPPQCFPQELPSAVVESQDSRPDSTYSQCSQASQFSQFSLSLFPSPPSVSLVRPTTENGTFRTGRAAPPPSPYKEHGQAEGVDAGTSTLRFKPIIPSTRAKPHVRAVLFERDENGQAVLSMPLTAPRFAGTRSEYSSASSSSASSAGTGTYAGSDSFMASSYIGTTITPTSVTHADRHLSN